MEHSETHFSQSPSQSQHTNDDVSHTEETGIFSSCLYTFWNKLGVLISETIQELQEIDSEYSLCIEELKSMEEHCSSTLKDINDEKEHIAGALQNLVSSASEVLGFSQE
ncbi:hypothetical protein GEMRC1_004191 [Eukaryota sp. GEM-RC1]